MQIGLLHLISSCIHSKWRQNYCLIYFSVAKETYLKIHKMKARLNSLNKLSIDVLRLDHWVEPIGIVMVFMEVMACLHMLYVPDLNSVRVLLDRFKVDKILDNLFGKSVNS